MATFTRIKVGAKGGGRFLDPMTGAKFSLTKRAFADGVAPETIELTCENYAPANPKAVKKALSAEERQVKLAESVAKANARAAKLQEKLQKATEKAEALNAKVASM